MSGSTHTVLERFTLATPIEKTVEGRPFDFEAAERRNRNLMICVALGSVIAGVLFGGGLGLSIALASIPIVVVLRLLHKSSIKQIKVADDKMAEKGAHNSITGYRGACPYCNVDIVLKAGLLAADCRICNNRILIRDSKFYLIPTPVVTMKSDA